MSWIVGELFKAKAKSTVNEGMSSIQKAMDPEPEKKSYWDQFCDTVNDGVEGVRETFAGNPKQKKEEELKKNRENREKIRAKYNIQKKN
jgi:hypothetical protein